jgi:branched-chain amino acid aminotransferase
VLVFLNGAFVPEEKAVVSIFDRGFLYGDGLFETIRVVNGKPFRWREHIERLRAGAKFLKVKLPFSLNRIQSVANELIRENGMPDCLLRITLTRGIGAAGYSPAKARKPTLAIALRPAPKLDVTRAPQWKLVSSSFRLIADDPLGRFKTCNKLPQILARAEADEAGADEALLLNTDGNVAEGTSSNVFWIKGGAIYTPPIAAGILPGVTRSVVLELAAGLGVATHEKNIRLKNIGRMEGVFLSLTSRGIVEATSLDGKALKTSDLTRRVRDAYDELVKRV